MVGALALGSFLVGLHLGPIFAIAHARAFLRHRPAVRNRFGQGVGPLVVAALNDVLKVDFGAQAVRYSLLSTAVTTMLRALFFVVAARWIRDGTSSGRPELKRYPEAAGASSHPENPANPA
jgi:hypothetical protein